MASSSSSSEPELKSEQEVIARFQDMRRQLAALVSNLQRHEAEAAEHDLVIKQLEPMDKARKCYRLIGDVLVERSVAETLPAVQRNRAGLEEVMKQLKAQILTADKAMAAFAAKYKIRFVGAGDDDEGAGSSKPKQAPGAGGSSSKGVLA